MKTGVLSPRATSRILRGDDTGSRTTLVYLGRERIGLFDGWSQLSATLEPEGRLVVDPAGCQFLLAYGLVPPPYTLYEGVFALGVGDRLELRSDGEATFSVDYPYFEARSRADGVFDPIRLKELLAGAVERAVPQDGSALLMLSSGKDSTGLLIGIAEAGRTNVRAVTYDPRVREREAEPAAELAKRFGLRHQIVSADPTAELDAFLAFAERSPSICADVALFPYLTALERADVADGVVLDGLGNDAYMGYVEPRRDALLRRLSLARPLPRLWGRSEPPAAGARMAYLWKTVQMYPAERSLAGSRLAPSTVQRLIPVETPFSRYFSALDRNWSHLAPLDFRSYVRGRLFDGCMTMPKGRLAAADLGARAVYPYCDEALIEYCFHLPAADRYDLGTRTNKIALRRLLADEVGDALYLRRKGSFRFDVVRFVDANRSAIREQIEQARPLLRDLDRLSRFLMARRSNYVHAYELVTLFMVCAWLIRRPVAAVRRLHEAETRTGDRATRSRTRGTWRVAGP